jgi:phage terminase small subunit
MKSSPPTYLSSEQAAAWRAIEPRLRRRGVFWDGIAGGRFALVLLCSDYHSYVRARDAAAVTKGREQRKWLHAAEDARLRTRELASKFFDLIPPERIKLAPLGANGEDAEITAWFMLKEEETHKGNEHCDALEAEGASGPRSSRLGSARRRPPDERPGRVGAVCHHNPRPYARLVSNRWLLWWRPMVPAPEPRSQRGPGHGRCYRRARRSHQRGQAPSESLRRCARRRRRSTLRPAMPPLRAGGLVRG